MTDLLNPDLRIEQVIEEVWTDENKEAVWWKGEWWSYGRLNALASDCEEKLKKSGFRRGERAALLLPNSPIVFAIAFAVWRLGGTIAPLNGRMNPLYLQNTIKMLDLSAVFVLADIAAKREEMESAIAVPIIPVLPDAKLPDKIETRRASVADDGSTAVIFSTSGTSGMPKAVPCSHSNILANIEDIPYALPGIICDDTVLLNALPNFHTFGSNISGFLPFVKGVRQALVPNFIPVENTIETIRQSGANTLVVVPTLLNFLIGELARRDEKLNVRFIVSGGDKLNPQLEERSKKYLGTGVCEGYGLTECSPVVAVNPPSDDKKLGTVGPALKHFETKLCDINGEDTDKNEGVLWVKGPAVVKSYFRDEKNTEERFKDGWFNTGDVVRVDEHGFITIIDRATDIIIVGGFNVYPQEVEAVLCSHPAVHAAICVGEANRFTGELVKAFIIPEHNVPVTSKELQDYCKGRLAHYKVPRKIGFVTEYPLSQTGKILRRELRKQKIDSKAAPEIKLNPAFRLENAYSEAWKGRENNDCVWWNGEWWSWKKFNALVDSCEEKLKNAGFEQGQRVAMLLPNSPSAVALSIACWRLGGAVAPLNARAGISNLLSTIEMLDVHTLVLSADAMKRAEDAEFQTDVPMAVLDPEKGFLTDWKGRKGLPDSVDTAVIFSTSGTSGMPKAVPCTHANLLDNARCIKPHIAGLLDPEKSIFLNVLPNFHTFGFGCAQTLPLVSSVRQVIVPSFVPVPNTVKAIKTSGANAIIAVPTILAFLLGALEKAGMKLDVDFVISGGDKLNTKLDERCKQYLGAGIIEGYGLTECSPVVAVGRSEASKRLGKVGEFLKSYQIEIRDRDGRKLDLHDEGVLWLKGGSVVSSYFRDETNTKERFKDGWFNTGDVVRIDGDGFVQIVDRATDIIIVSGFNVYPQEVENVLCEHPAVQSAVCVGEKNNVAGELVKAFVILKPGAEVTERQLMTYCKERLSHYKVPRKIGFVTEYPVSPTGKVLRRELRKIKIGKN